MLFRFPGCDSKMDILSTLARKNLSTTIDLNSSQTSKSRNTIVIMKSDH